MKGHLSGYLREAPRIAKAFHETYERLAPHFDYETRRDSGVPWAEVPEKNRLLMEGVVDELLSEKVIFGAALAAREEPQTDEMGLPRRGPTELDNRKPSRPKPMSLHPADALLATLTGIADSESGDTEIDHCDADDALVRFAEATAPAPRGKEICAAWDRIGRWYA
jgi:hypothetical protein